MFQLAMLPVLFAVVAALSVILGFVAGIYVGVWRDFRRGLSNRWLAFRAEAALDKEERRSEKQARKEAAMDAARRRRATGRRQE
jgi:hypothetical protein